MCVILGEKPLYERRENVPEVVNYGYDPLLRPPGSKKTKKQEKK
jgi:hypothetical protein